MPLKKVGDYSMQYLQILDEKGKLDAKLDPKMSDEQLVHLYRSMLLARRADERMLKLQRQGRVGTFPPTTGQEAAQCAPVIAMTDRDWYVPSFREMGGLLMRGLPLWKHYLFHNGYEEGNVFDGESRTLPTSIIVASQFLHATGIAYAMKYRGEKDSAVVAFGGDGSTSQGDFHEALNFASVWQVPVVFIIQNNQWAISLPRSKQTHSATLAQKAIAYDMPGIQVDGNDPLAMYRAAKDALDRARSGKGPTLIEAVTYRLMMHTTSDDPGKYRDENITKEWWEKDPLKRFAVYLESRGLFDDEKNAAFEAEAKAQVDEAVGQLEAFSSDAEDAPFRYAFASDDPYIEAQRREFLALQDTEDSNG